MPIYTFTTIDDPLARQETYAYAINAGGQIVGYYRDTSLATHGFLYNGATYTALDDPLAVAQAGDTLAYGINAQGQIVGQYADLHDTHGFLYSGGTYTTLDDPSATSGTRAFGINATGQIVGIYVASGGAAHGFLYDPNSVTPHTTIDDPLGVHGTIATGINAAGQIVGYYIDSNFAGHGFLYSNSSYTTLDDPLASGGWYDGLGHQ
jgi:probable HAF family extracellular repeat protein